MRKDITKAILEQKYLTEEKTPYQIAQELNCDHKTIRSYLKKYSIPLRNASEYNFLARKNYVSPSDDEILTKKSIAAHIAYLCEGWHTKKSNQVYFCNQDTQLIDLVVDLLYNVYKVSNVRFQILTPTHEQAIHYLEIYPDSKVIIDKSRKNPIIRIFSGGKMLVRDLIQNCYKIISFL